MRFNNTAHYEMIDKALEQQLEYDKKRMKENLEEQDSLRPDVFRYKDLEDEAVQLRERIKITSTLLNGRKNK